MVKTLLGLLLLLWTLPALALPPYDNPGTNAAAQDAEGTVWALGDSGIGTVKRWFTTTAGKTGTWIPETVPGAAGFESQALTRGADGAIYVLWHKFSWDSNSLIPCLITVHRGGEWYILARFSEPVSPQAGWPAVRTLLADADGSLWLAGNQLLLRHISPSGIVTPFPLTPEQQFNHKLPSGFSFPRYDSLTDSAGRRWFWQYVYNRSWQLDSLRGVLIWDGKSLGYHSSISGVPDRPFSALALLDANHLWLATTGGLYKVDTRTLSAVAEMPPQPGAFQNVVQIFQANGDWYAVDESQQDQSETLWRKHAGQWRKCVDKIEEVSGYFQPDPRHLWLAEPDGLWLGTHSGLWWVPRNGRPAIWVNWRRGLFLSNISSLSPLNDGSILAVGSPETAQIPAQPQPLRPLPPKIALDGMGAPEHLGPLVSDRSHHLWGVINVYSASCSLEEWDGVRWRTHLTPKGITGITGLYDFDTLGRLWLNTQSWNPPTQPQPVEGRAVYNPAQDTWKSYATVADALQDAATVPNMQFLSHRSPYPPPIFSRDGHITYEENFEVYFYDGHRWRHWEAREIRSNNLDSHFDSPPHFNAHGHLEVALNSEFWELTDPDGWQRSGKSVPDKSEPATPPGGPAGMWVPPVVDSLGRKWFFWQGKVYVAWHGLWADLPELSAFGSPFAGRASVENVLTDPMERIFFVIRPVQSYEFVVWSPPSVPKPTLSIVPTSDDSVIVRLLPKLPRPDWYLWRLNGGPWSQPQKTGTLTFATLPHGDYRVEVQALDRRLQASPIAVAVFNIRVAPETQIARWVSALLHGTDDQREIAVAGLVKQPDAALPALQAARVGASESARWWIDAAMQQIREGQ